MKKQGLTVSVTGITAQVEMTGQAPSSPPASGASDNNVNIIAIVAGTIFGLAAIAAAMLLVYLIKLKRSQCKVGDSNVIPQHEPQNTRHDGIEHLDSPPLEDQQTVEDTPDAASNMEQESLVKPTLFEQLQTVSVVSSTQVRPDSVLVFMHGLVWPADACKRLLSLPRTGFSRLRSPHALNLILTYIPNNVTFAGCKPGIHRRT
jgi:hypothetical protein